MDESKPAPGAHYRYRFGTAEFDEAKFELRVGGLATEVQQKPLQLLALLLAAAGAVVTREEISGRIWGHRVTVENVIANAVSKLRSALGEENAKRLVTAPRQGYRLTGPVQRMAVDRKLASPMALHAGAPVPGRENFVLAALLGNSRTGETWLAHHAKSGHARVYKFAADSERLAELKREVTLYRVLKESLGEREDMARILDWNFEQAPYFLESEYGGVSLAAWAQEPAGATSRLAQTPASERLLLMLQITDAVAAAHGVGVLHKDLKPANVLVYPAAGGWKVRLTDFGSARLLDPERIEALRITPLGMTLAPGAGSDAGSGTPFYLAPELGLGEVPTVRSDVFALGVMLFQTLAGDLRKQMAPGWEREIGDELLRDDIARATDMEPRHRLKSAAELAERLRSLDARRAALAALRAGQQRAHQTRLALARSQARYPWVAAAMSALLLGGAVSLWLYVAERRAVAALEQQFEVADALNRLLREGIIAAANPAAAGRSDITVAAALASAADSIDEKFAQRSPLVRAGLHQALQSAFSELSQVQAAATEGQRALAAYALAAGSGVQQVQQVQDVRLRLALDLAQLSRLDDAARVIEQIERDAGPSSRQTAEFRARLLYVKAWQTGDKLTLKGSLQLLREAWSLVDPMSLAQAPWRTKIEFALADTLRLIGEAAEAEKLFRRLLVEQTHSLGAGHVRTYYTMVGLGNVVSLQSRWDEATALLNEAAKGLAAKLGPQHRMTLSATEMLADMHFRRRDYERAFAEWSEVHRGYSALLGESSSYTVAVQTHLGIARHHGGRAAESEPVLRDALARVRSFARDDAPQAQHIRYSLADCLLDLRKPADVSRLLAGLSPGALNEAQAQPDWSGRIAYQEGRLALQKGDRAKALMRLAEAQRLLVAATVATAAAPGRINETTVRALLDTIKRGG